MLPCWSGLLRAALASVAIVNTAPSRECPAGWGAGIAQRRDDCGGKAPPTCCGAVETPAAGLVRIGAGRHLPARGTDLSWLQRHRVRRCVRSHPQRVVPHDRGVWGERRLQDWPGGCGRQLAEVLGRRPVRSGVRISERQGDGSLRGHHVVALAVPGCDLRFRGRLVERLPLHPAPCRPLPRGRVGAGASVHPRGFRHCRNSLTDRHQ